MDVDTRRTDGSTVVAVTGDVDAGSAYDLYLAAVREAEDGYSTVVVDLSGVTFIDSVGLGMLVRMRDELQSSLESRLQLRAPSQRVMSLLTLTALSTEFDIVTPTAGE